jgi:DNA polymerase-3 subunit epsilon
MFRNLVLVRPLAIIDLETTGTDAQTDRIVEIGVLKIQPDGHRDIRCRRINPGIHIPESATAIHGITDSDVASEPAFGLLAPGLLKYLEGCDLCGFNLKRFDLKVLIAEFNRVGRQFSLEGRKVIDPLEIYHDRERRDLSAALRFYCGREHDEAHCSSADIEATADILEAMLGRYPDLPRTVDGLHETYRDQRSVDVDGKFLRVEGRIIFNFGKYRGRELGAIARESPDYLHWMLDGSFLADTKQTVRFALDQVAEQHSTVV